MDRLSATSALLGLLLLSGCAAHATPSSPQTPAGAQANQASQAQGAQAPADPGTPQTQAQATAAAAPVPVQHYAKTFHFTDTEAAVAGATDAEGSNCLVIRGDSLDILNGNATATWSAATPLAAHFSVFAVNWPDLQAHAEGTSPVRLDFEALGALKGDGDYLLGFELDQGQPAGLNAQQGVDFAVAFDYTGSTPDVNANASCAIGM